MNMMINDIYKKWKSIIDKYTDRLTISAFYISKNCPSKIYFGYDGSKKYIYLEFDPIFISNFKCPNIKGLDIQVCDIPSISDSFKYIQITNIDNKDEVFLAFSSTLYNNLLSCNTYYDCVETLIGTLQYYKTYFSNPKRPLTDEEEQGLFCELVYLDRMIKQYGDCAIKNWEGPYKNKRDFVFEDHSVEIKSTSGQIAPSIRISNENQLDQSYPTSIKLFLKVFIVEKIDDGDSLTCIAKRIFDSINTIEFKNLFIQKLLMNKVDINLYEDLNSYSIQKEHYYFVNDNFPKICPSNINKNIFKVEYRISLIDLDEFERKE